MSAPIQEYDPLLNNLYPLLDDLNSKKVSGQILNISVRKEPGDPIYDLIIRAKDSKIYNVKNCLCCTKDPYIDESSGYYTYANVNEDTHKFIGVYDKMIFGQYITLFKGQINWAFVFSD